MEEGEGEEEMPEEEQLKKDFEEIEDFPFHEEEGGRQEEQEEWPAESFDKSNTII